MLVTNGKKSKDAPQEQEQEQNNAEHYRYGTEDLAEAKQLLETFKANIRIEQLLNIYAKKIEKDINDRTDFDKRAGEDIFDVEAVTDNGMEGIDDSYYEKMSTIAELLPQCEPSQIIRILKETNGDTDRSIDLLLNEANNAPQDLELTPIVMIPTDPIIDLEILEQKRAYENMSSTGTLTKEIRHLEETFIRHTKLNETLMADKDSSIDDESQHTQEEEDHFHKTIIKEREWIEKQAREAKKNKNVKFYCDGELELINHYLLTGENEIKRYPFLPTRVFDCDAEHIHFRIPESAFHRQGSVSAFGGQYQCKIESVEYIVNPKLIQDFQQKRIDLAKQHGFLLESMKPLLLFHGTSEVNMENIIKTNFLMSKVGSSTDMGFYGRGAYFSEYPGMSIAYSRGNPYLLICLVLVGKAFRMSTVQTGRAIEPGYDSHTSPDGCSEVVIFDPLQILPCYKVKYIHTNQQQHYHGY